MKQHQQRYLETKSELFGHAFTEKGERMALGNMKTRLRSVKVVVYNKEPNKELWASFWLKIKELQPQLKQKVPYK